MTDQTIKTGRGNVKKITRGPDKGMFRVLSGTFRNLRSATIRVVDEGHNVILQPDRFFTGKQLGQTQDAASRLWR